MKKLLLFLAVGMCASMVLEAAVLTPEQALERLNGANAPARVASLKGVKATPVYTATTPAGMPAVYVFNRADNGGFLLVSADDVAAPLLGYTDRGAFSEAGMPPQMQWWLGEYAKEIAGASARTGKYVVAASESTDFPAIAPLVQTLWDQSTPYNNLCPTVDGKTSVTGCVATAMAQVMNYFQYPAKGSGSITYTDTYNNTSTQRTMNFANTTFDWDNMLDIYNEGSYNTTQATAVATLMKACGYSVQMSYTPTESGASVSYVPDALTNYFGYNTAVTAQNRIEYGIDEWNELIYNNLKNVGPVLYTGQSNIGGGHAFVCDGYQSNGYFHFNWGWSGYYDGYFLLTALNPEGQGIGGSMGGYNLSQVAVLNIQKPGGTVNSFPARLTFVYNSTSYPVSATVGTNYLTFGGLWANWTGEAVNLSVGFELEPVGGGTPTYITMTANTSIPANSGYTQVKLPLYNLSVDNGTYKVRVVTKDLSQSNPEWLPALCNINHPDYVLLTCNYGTFSAQVPSAEYLTVNSASLDTPFYYGSSAQITMNVSNNNDSETALPVAPGLISGNSLVGMGECVFFDLKAGETVSHQLTFDMAYTSSAALNNSYTMVLYDPVNSRVLYELGTVTLTQASSPTLRQTAFTLEGGNVVTDKHNMTFDATVRCAAGYYAKPIVLVVVRNTTTVFQQDSQETLFLNAGQSASTTIHANFANAQEEETYQAYLFYYKNNSGVQLTVSPIEFTISDVSGVEDVNGDAQFAFAYYAPAHAVLMGGAIDATTVEVYNIAGQKVEVPVTESNADLSALPSGVYVVTATDTAGRRHTLKVAR